MDEILLKQLVRQLKIINFWIASFGLLFLATLVVVAVLIFKMVTFVQSTEQKLSDLQSKTQSTLDLKQQACDNSSISKLLPGDTCN